MTITYANGTVGKATVLSHTEFEIRAFTADCDDALVFSRIPGSWISEEIDPVIIEFDWQRRVEPPVPSVDDCICPKELASHLIHTLLADGEPQLDKVYFGGEENRMAVCRTELHPM